MRTPRIPLLRCLAGVLALSLAGCTGGSGERVTSGSTSVEVPEGFVEITDGPLTSGGWEHVYADSEDDPTTLLRMSQDLGRAPAADTTFSSLQGEALFQNSYGPDFSVIKRTDIDIRNADRALEVEFSYATDAGDAMTGYWWLFSSTSTGATAAVEISGEDLSAEDAEAVKKSIRYKP